MRSWIGCLTIFLAGCTTPGIKGNGEVKSEPREVAAFSELEAGGAYTLQVTIGEQRRLELRTDANLLPLIESRVEGKRLRLRTLKSLRPTDGVRVEVTTPSLDRLDVSGAVKGAVQGVSNERFVVKLSGAGKLQLQGQTKQLELAVSGAGKIEAQELKATSVRVDSSGAGSIEVFASEALDVKVSGVGKVAYHGNPRRVTKKISGVGKVVKR